MKNKMKIINDKKFRHNCNQYGLYWENFEIIDNVIVVKHPNKEIYVLFDEEYNTIGIYNANDIKNNQSMEKVVPKYKELYENVDEEHRFAYPFQNLSLSQINLLANRVQDIFEKGYQNDFCVDGKDILGIDYKALLSYIYFLKDQIDKYFIQKYQMKILNFEFPNVYSYINQVMENLNECIFDMNEKHVVPCPSDCSVYLGQKIEKESYYEALYHVIKFILKEIQAKTQEINLKLKVSNDNSVLVNHLPKILEKVYNN